MSRGFDAALGSVTCRVSAAGMSCRRGAGGGVGGIVRPGTRRRLTPWPATEAPPPPARPVCGRTIGSPRESIPFACRDAASRPLSGVSRGRLKRRWLYGHATPNNRADPSRCAGTPALSNQAAHPQQTESCRGLVAGMDAKSAKIGLNMAGQPWCRGIKMTDGFRHVQPHLEVVAPERH